LSNGAHGRTGPARTPEKAMAEALEHRGPVLVDLVTDPHALSMPPHITAAEVKGVALAASKMVLGGIGQKLEIARANLANIPGVGVLTST
jgi:pyruvate dehydrogenase (quinone)